MRMSNRIKYSKSSVKKAAASQHNKRNYTSSWNSDLHPGSTINASPHATKLLFSLSFETFSGANMIKFVVRKGIAVLLPIGTSLTPGGYS